MEGKEWGRRAQHRFVTACLVGAAIGVFAGGICAVCGAQAGRQHCRAWLAVWDSWQQVNQCWCSVRALQPHPRFVIAELPPTHSAPSWCQRCWEPWAEPGSLTGSLPQRCHPAQPLSHRISNRDNGTRLWAEPVLSCLLMVALSVYICLRVNPFQEQKWNVTTEHPECVGGCVVLVVLHNIRDSQFCWFLTVCCVYYTCEATCLFFLWTKRKHLTGGCFSVHMPLLHTHSWISHSLYGEIYCEYNWLGEMKHLQWVIERY